MLAHQTSTNVLRGYQRALWLGEETMLAKRLTCHRAYEQQVHEFMNRVITEFRVHLSVNIDTNMAKKVLCIKIVVILLKC